MIRHMTETDPNEAVDLARIILEDTEGGHPKWDLYTLNVHEARTLANAVTRAALHAVGALIDAETDRASSKPTETPTKETK